MSLLILTALAAAGWYLVRTGPRAAWWGLLVPLSGIIGFLIYVGLGLLGLLVSLATGRTVPYFEQGPGYSGLRPCRWPCI